jgi:hypothetical protein
VVGVTQAGGLAVTAAALATALPPHWARDAARVEVRQRESVASIETQVPAKNAVL